MEILVQSSALARKGRIVPVPARDLSSGIETAFASIIAVPVDS